MPGKPLPFDPHRPNPARIYDYWLGGTGFDADREVARRIEALYPAPGRGRLPVPVEAAVGNRAFADRAVTWAAQQGIRRFLDLGSGVPSERPPSGLLPAIRSVHRAARAVAPAAKVAYVDNDPAVLLRARALLWGARGVTVTEADLTDPAGVLSDPAVRSVMDPGEPVCLIAAMVLHFLPPQDAAKIMGEYAVALAPGSALVISCGTCADPDLYERLAAAWTAGETFSYGPGDIRDLFGGTELIAPGLALAGSWRPGWRDSRATPDGAAYVLAGVARKPR